VKKLEFAFGIALIGILLFHCFKLSNLALVAHKKVKLAIREDEVSKRELGFQQEAGIDIYGKLVAPLPPPQEERAVVFLLRSQSLYSDLTFWKAVQKELTGGVRLIAYCNDDECSNFLKEQSEKSFPVIAFGEVLGTQALMQADEDGECFVRSEYWLVAKPIKWRGTGASPETISESLASLTYEKP
jgi:hypothetical protein